MTYNFLFTYDTLTLFALAAFPRITLFLVSFKVDHGVGYYLGFLFAPSLLIAIYSLEYWHTNPLLVIAAWIIALIRTLYEGVYIMAFLTGLVYNISRP